MSAKILGWIHIVLSGGLLLAWGALCLSLLASADASALHTLAYVFFGVLYLGVPLLLPSLIGGVGLVRGAAWARVLIGVVSAILILVFPIGTVLGVLGLWILFFRTKTTKQQPLAAPTPDVAPLVRGEPGRVGGVLLAMAGVMMGFIVMIGAGFRLNHQTTPAPLGALFYPALIALVLIIGFAVRKGFSQTGGGPRTLNPITLARRRAEMRRSREAFEEAQRRRMAELMNDPARRKYAMADIPWADQDIAYDMDKAALRTCEHLQPIEKAMRLDGLELRTRHGAHMRAPCRVNEEALREMLRPGPSTIYKEYYLGGRSVEDDPEAVVGCTLCNSGIHTQHPEVARPEDRWFPAPPV